MQTIKLSCLCLMLWVISPAAKSQLHHPGGVAGAVQWFTADSSLTTTGMRNLVDSANTLLPVANASMASFNFHPSLILGASNFWHVPLADRDLRNATYFTVYQSLDTSAENNIWYFSNDAKTTLVLTTDRMADLAAYKYMNYKDVVRANPKVNIYVQFKDKDTVVAKDQWWNIGAKPTTPQLPIKNFKGLIPEVIIYNRVLNSTERLQVATYLAIKYGITITEPGANYLNSNADKIWDGYDYPDWHHNIAGICRDDAGNLLQLIATSSNAPGLLTLSSKDSLQNNNFLLWGDNGMQLTVAPAIAGTPLLLQKTWLMKTYGNTVPFTTDIVLDTKPIDAALSINPVYWLAVDRSGEGKFNTAAVDFIKMSALDKNGKAYFKDIVWDKDGSGKDVMGVVAGKALMLASIINQPTCADPGSGNMQTKILGGQAPYQLTIKRNTNVLASKQIDDAATPFAITNLAAGKYQLYITDAAQNIYIDSFYINNDDAPIATSIDAGYAIAGGKSLQLNAAENMLEGITYEWNGPANFQSYNPQVIIAEPGLYTLRSTKSGCSNVQDVKITALPNNILTDVTIYPNPTPSGYNARVTLDKPAMVTMAVYGPDGKLVSVQKGNERAHYLFTGQLKAAGVYRVVFTSGLSTTTKTLVIAK